MASLFARVKTHSPLFLYPEDGYGGGPTAAAAAAAHQQRRAAAAAPPTHAAAAPLNPLPSFQSVFLPVYQSKTQQSLQVSYRI